MNALSTLFLCAALGGGGGDDPPQKPELRLRPAVALRGLHVTIGDLCELKPVDATTQAIAQVRFGPAPVNGYSRTVSRTDVVQALAAAGVPLAALQITGSDEVVVQTITTEVPQQALVEAAGTALQALLAVEGGDVEFEPPAQVLRCQAPPGRVSQELRARVRDARTGPTSAVVDVEVMIDGESFKKVPLTFKLQRWFQVLKTVGSLRKDTPLGPDNIELVREPMAQSTGLFLDRMTQVEGMTAARNLQPGQRLTLGDIAPPALVRRGDIVTVVLTRGRVKVTAKALANEDAPLGGRVHLTNTSSRSVLTGVVYGTGLVVVNQ